MWGYPANPEIRRSNAGIPMLMVLWPLVFLSFIPIVAIETAVVMRMLKTPFRISVLQVSKANLYSSIIGIPFAWILSFSIQLSFTALFILASKMGVELDGKSLPIQVFGTMVSSPWLAPSYRSSPGVWMVQVATLVLLVPCFFVSFWMEAKVIAKTLLPDDPKSARRAIWRANLASYGILFGAIAIWLVISLIRHSG